MKTSVVNYFRDWAHVVDLAVRSLDLLIGGALIVVLAILFIRAGRQ